MSANIYIPHVTTPFVLTLDWIEPLDALLALGDEEGTLGFIGGGAHALARWSCIMCQPIEVKQWSEGDRGHPFDGLQGRLDRQCFDMDPDLGPFQGGWAGLLGYELGRAFEALPWPGGGPRPLGGPWPDMWLGFYDTVGVFDSHLRRAFIVSWSLDGDLSSAQKKAHDLAQMFVPYQSQTCHQNSDGLHPTRTRCDGEAAIARTVDYIHAGDIFQANVSLGFRGTLPKGDTPLGLFARLVTRHPSPFATFLSLKGLAVVSHSPERFLSRTPDGQLETRPIKGTAPRHSDPSKDAAFATALTLSEKDRAENLMIVDLMRNDLSRVCVPGSVKVPRLCALESFSTVHHLVSDVIGQQKPGLGFFDALAASFPPGSITGAPKVRAMEIIAELEGEPRGPWCGSMIRVGFDGRADSSVLIRTAACVKDGDMWHVTARAGAGIVADSRPDLEYDEMLVKARALRTAVGGFANEAS